MDMIKTPLKTLATWFRDKRDDLWDLADDFALAISFEIIRAAMDQRERERHLWPRVGKRAEDAK